MNYYLNADGSFSNGIGDTYSNGQSVGITDGASIYSATATTLPDDEQQGEDGTEAAEYAAGATALSYDLTTHTTQYLANTFRGSAEAVNVSDATIIKGLTIEGGSRTLGVVGLAVTGYDMYKNGLNWSNGTDGIMGGVAFIPGIGWVISGAYLIGNAAVEGATGESIGDHIGDFYNSHPIAQIGVGIGLSTLP